MTSRPTSIMLTDATDRQIEALKGLGFGGLTDIVRIAVDRMYNQEAREMTEKYDGYEIKVEYSDASLWGDVDPEAEGYDEYESAQAYEHNVEAAIEREFPGAEIEIIRGINDRLTVEDDEGPDLRLADEVQHEIGKVYQDFDAWMIEAKTQRERALKLGRTIAATANEIVEAAGGDFTDCVRWLLDGDFDPADPIQDYIDEWEEAGCEYVA